MRKFEIELEYKGFTFSADVEMKSHKKTTIISATLIEHPLDFLLRKSTFIFLQQGAGFQLLLYKKDRTFEILSWKVKTEHKDNSTLTNAGVFSLS